MLSRPTTCLSFRIELGLKDVLTIVSNEFKISLTQLITLSIVDYLKKIDLPSLNLNGTNLHEYIKATESEQLRSILGKVRANLISKYLFMNRVKLDVMKLVRYNRPIEEVITVIKQYEKEAKCYSDNEDLLAEITKFKNFDKENYSEFKKYFDDSLKVFEEDEYLKRSNLQRLIEEKIENDKH